MNIDRDFYRDIHCVGGLPFDSVDTTACLSIIQHSIEQNRKIFFTTPNLNFVISSLSDRVFYNSVVESDLVIADGISIVLMSKLIGAPIKTRVAGSEIFQQLQEGNLKKTISVFFFGGVEGVAEKAASNLKNNRFVQCVGTYYPGFLDVDSMSEDAIIQQINQTSPQFLVVALGAKKGQLWIKKNLHRLNVNVVSHLGAVINFVAGTVKRAPTWFQKLGLEWLWRIKEEPTLWKRYYFDALILIRLLASNLLPLLVLNFYLKHLCNANKESANIIFEENTSCVRLIFSGSFHGNVCIKHRDMLKEAVSLNKNLQLDLSQVTFLGSSIMALLVMLHYYVTLSGNKFNVVSMSRCSKKQLKYNLLEYLYKV